MRLVTHADAVGAPPLSAIWLAASAAPAGSAGRDPGGSSENASAASGIITAETKQSSRMKTPSVRAPICPMDLRSAAEATPVTSSATTSGMTVMRMAFTHKVPSGASASAARSNAVLPDAPTSAPSRMARTSATRTRVLSFTCLRVGVRVRIREVPMHGATFQLHHQVAAVDVERSAGEISRRLRCGKADEIRHFECSAKARYRKALRQPLE